MSEITALEPEWRPPQAKAVFEYLQQQIAEAMRVPDWAIHHPEAQRRCLQEAHEMTAVLRKLATQLYLEHCWPRCNR